LRTLTVHAGYVFVTVGCNTVVVSWNIAGRGIVMAGGCMRSKGLLNELVLYSLGKNHCCLMCYSLSFI
jgi:hypothetical protein